MNVQTASARTLATVSPRRSEGASAPPAETPPEAPKDNVSFGGKIGQSAVRTGIAWGNAFGIASGGATGLATMTGALYAGVLGGAVTGAALGMGFGPVLSSVTSNGALSFIGTTFSTAGAFAKAGIAIGGIAGAAGAWQVGNGIGSAVGKTAGFILGAPVGAVQGLWSSAEGVATGQGTKPVENKENQKPKETVFTDLNKMSGPMKVYASVVGGVGMLSGAVGGFTIGASVASAGNLLSGLMASNVSLSSIGGAAMVGGVVGGALFGVIGGFGGFNVAKLTKKGWDMTGAKLVGLAHGGESLNQKSDRLEQKEQGLRVRQDGIEKTAGENRVFHQTRTKELDERESGIATKEKDVQGRLDTINTAIEDSGQAQYKDRASKPDAQTSESLVDWQIRLNGKETKLNGFETQIKNKEAGLDNTIKTEGDKKYETVLRPPLEKEYQGKQNQLTEFEGRLNNEEASIKNETDSRYNSEVSVKRPPLENELSGARRDADRAAEQRRTSQRDRDLAATMLASAQGNLSSARGDRDRASGRLNNLNRAIQELRIEQSNLQLEHSQADGTKSQLENELRQCENS